ncbi:hypothetical protein GCK32_008704 [Trichostrongylus colubriformis]|uniref:Uncharacterized protein n=1 Tax=Trichostrongylus colubriformis TaxID=6319 RepID=A0AAN8J2A5_TRICO
MEYESNGGDHNMAQHQEMGHQPMDTDKHYNGHMNEGYGEAQSAAPRDFANQSIQSFFVCQCVKSLAVTHSEVCWDQ